MQQIKSNLIGWIETSRLCLSYNKVSWNWCVNKCCLRLLQRLLLQYSRLTIFVAFPFLIFFQHFPGIQTTSCQSFFLSIITKNTGSANNTHSAVITVQEKDSNYGMMHVSWTYRKDVRYPRTFEMLDWRTAVDLMIDNWFPSYCTFCFSQDTRLW